MYATISNCIEYGDELYAVFPADEVTLSNYLEYLNCTSNIVLAEFSDSFSTIPDIMFDEGCVCDIHVFNELVEKIEGLTDEEYNKFECMINAANKNYSFKDYLQIIDRLDEVETFKCENYEELERIAVNLGVLERTTDSSEVMSYDQLAKLLCEQTRGGIYNGLFCKPFVYESNIKIGSVERKLDPALFRLTLAKTDKEFPMIRELNFPCNDSKIFELKMLGYVQCVEFISSVPMLYMPERVSIEDMTLLNKFAESLSGMSDSKLAEIKDVIAESRGDDTMISLSDAMELLQQNSMNSEVEAIAEEEKVGMEMNKMTVRIRYGDKELSWGLPVSTIHVQDILDRMNVQGGREIEYKFSNYDMVDLPADVLDKWHKADIYKLNVFAERFQQLEDYQKAGFKSVLMKNPDSSIDDMIAMTYGIEGVPVYPADDYAELGEIAIDNDMLPEIAQCPDEAIPLLDRELVGKRLAETDDGVLLDGYYCMPDSYEEPDLSLTIEVPDKRFFRVLVSSSATTTDQAQWFDLPEDIRRLREYSAEWNATPEQMYITEVESVLPNITDAAYYEAYWVEGMIALSEQMTCMSKAQIVKLKAVMEAENIHTFSGARDAIDCLNEYDFDPMVQDESQFGKAYACRVFPTNFDWSILENCDMYDFGREVLKRKGGEVTEYGALSGKGQKLYTALTAKPVSLEEIEEQNEDMSENEDESEEIIMGGMT